MTETDNGICNSHDAVHFETEHGFGTYGVDADLIFNHAVDNSEMHDAVLRYLERHGESPNNLVEGSIEFKSVEIIDQ